MTRDVSPSPPGPLVLLLLGGLLAFPPPVLTASAHTDGPAPERGEDPGEPTAPQQACPAAADSLVRAGWRAYRDGRIDVAGARFHRALARCPCHVGARVGTGYVALRQGNDGTASRRFRSVLDQDSTVVDALVGMGILAWRAGELERVSELFRRVERLDPDNETARRYLARLPDGLGPPPERPPLRRSDTLSYPARARGDHFEVRTDDGWRSLYVKGVNLGAALPGKFPSQFPEAETYRSWIRQIGRMEANAIRLYTIHPPAFYEALATYNRAHPGDVLWLIHGVWTELPPDGDYEDPGFRSGFHEEMRRAVDVVHGRADLAPRPGHASGHYVANVSEWTLAFVIGREWEPYSVERHVRNHPRRSSWEGRYLEARNGNAMDVWLARMCEYLVAYETREFGEQRPIAYTSWPTLDPLHHPTEATSRERWQIRKAMGEQVASDPPPEVAFDDDGIAVDPSTIEATAAYPAGYFATYHVYPYYPDFLVLDPKYGTARSPQGPSNYFGYLRALQAHHEDLPVLIGEYGVPSGPGIAHLQPQGWHHGGHAEREMARISARLTREIAAAGMAGGILFEWIDEWFKRNWLVAPHEVPHGRDRMWWNRMDPEENYGVLAVEPEPRITGTTMSERRRSWSATTSATDGWPDAELRTAADEAGLWLWFEANEGEAPLEVLYVGFDVLDPDRGIHEWPDPAAGSSPVGLEFVGVLDSAGFRILPSRAARRFAVREIAPPRREPPAYRVPEIRDPPRGFFTGRWEHRFRQPRLSAPGPAEGFRPLRVVTNARRFGRDTTEFAALGYQRGYLPRGPSPDGFWRRSADGRTVELHIPWLLLNVSDPSSKRVVFAAREERDGPPASTSGSVTGVADPADVGMRHVGVRSIRVVLAGKSAAGRWHSWPGGESSADAATVSWDSWDEPRWRVRRRPLYEALSATFRALEPVVVRSDPSADTAAVTEDRDRGTGARRRR